MEWSNATSTAFPFRRRSSNLDNFTDTILDVTLVFKPIISDAAIGNIDLYLGVVITGILAMLGVVNNIINVTIFYKLGLRDSPSIGLFSLSATDLLITLLVFFTKLLVAWNQFASYTGSIDPIAIVYMLGWLRDISYICSGCILSIERCVCVTFPFKVKAIFTRLRSIVIISIVYGVHLALLITVYANATLGMAEVTVDTAQGPQRMKRLRVKFSANWPVAHLYLNTMTGAAIPVPCQVIITASVIWMIYGLKKTSKVRKSGSMTGDDKESSSLSSKERKLVKMMLVLAIIMAVCNLPRFAAIYCQDIDPDIAYGKREHNLFMLLWNVAIGANVLNCSINFFVYMAINRSYRSKFKELFWCK